MVATPSAPVSDSLIDGPVEVLAEAGPPDLAGVIQARRSLARYHVPEIQRFVSTCGLKPLRLRADVLAQVQDLMLSGSMTPSETALHALFDYIDGIKEHGEQHLFFFNLLPGQDRYLADLADPTWLKTHLRASDLEDRFGPGKLVVLPERFELARVELRSDPREELVLKWVDTRVWLQKRAMGPRRFEMERQSGRAVSFFRIDLGTGQAELGIESLRPNARPPLEEELRELLAEVGSIVELDRFEPVVMESAIHRLVLGFGPAMIREWRVDWAEGGRLEGHGEPSFVQGLPLRFGHFVAEQAVVDWPTDIHGQEVLVRLNLDSRLDSLEIPGRWPRAVLDPILAAVRRLGKAKLKVAELGKLAKERSDLEPALDRLEQEIEGRGKGKVTASEVAGESLVTAEQVEEAFKLLAARSPKVFWLRYRLVCPNTGKPEVDDGAIHWYSSRSEIPREIGCTFASGTVHTSTDRMVEAVLDFDPELKGPQLALRLHRMAVRSQIAKAAPASDIPRRIAAVLFLVLVSILTVALFLWVGSLFDQPWVGSVLIKVSSAVVGGEIAIVLATLGIVGDPARDWVRDILIFLAEKISSGRSEPRTAGAA